MRTLLIAVLLATVAVPSTANAQVDDICREFGVIPSLDMPWAQVPYLYGKVVLNGFDLSKPPRVTVIFADRDNPSKRLTLSRTGYYCFRRAASGGSIVIEIEGVEVARRPLPSFGAAQQREDFDIYPSGRATAPPGTVSAKLAYPRNEKTVELYQKAARAESEKQRQLILGYMKEIVAIDPADFVAWSLLGSLLLEGGSLAESDAALRKAIGLKVDYTPAWINVGRLRVAQQQLEAAIEIFKHAAELDPKSGRIFQLLGETYLQAKKGTLGAEALNESLRLDPVGMAESHLLLARLYDLAGAKKLATKEYKAFLGKVPQHPDKKKFEKYIKENPE